jgi:hypothetical protein
VRPFRVVAEDDGCSQVFAKRKLREWCYLIVTGRLEMHNGGGFCPIIVFFFFLNVFIFSIKIIYISINLTYIC